MKINAVIESKDGGTLVLDFPRSIYDVYEKLQSVGIRQSPHQVTLSDEDGDDVRVKLYSDDEIGKHLLLTLNERNSLADANMLAFMVDNAKPDFRSKLEQNLLHDQYGSMQEVTDAIKQMLYESGPVKAVFYCPLVGEVTDDEGFSSPVDGRFLKSYPQVIDEATVERMRSRKASRNTQTSTDRQSGIYLLKVPVVCPACGKPMHRLQDTRCKCTQKWVCNQCHIQIKKEDSVLMKDITDILNGVIRNPEIIQSAQPSQAEAPIEQRRLDNEIARVLEGYDFDKDALREKLYQRASLGYLQVGDEAYVEHKLKNTLEQHDILDCFDSELTNKIVKRIRLAESGSVSIILINDQEIRKEQTDHASSNT